MAVLRRTRLDSLTGLRAFAALAVLLDHVGILVGGAPARALHPVGVQGAMGVTFFFALSGFVLAWSARPGDTALAFYRRRLARVYPAYLVALAAGAAITRWEGAPLDVGPTLANVLLVQSWVPSLGYYFAVNGVGWSLSCEAFFYLCFPLLLPLLARTTRRTRRTTQALLLVALLAADVVGHRIGGVVGSSWVINHLPVVRMIEFTLGASAAIGVAQGVQARTDASRSDRRTRLGVLPAAALVVGVWVLGGQWTTDFTNVALPVVPFLLLLVACARRDTQGRPTVFSARPLVWLGEVSYAFYLVHQLVVRVEYHLVGGNDGWAGGVGRIVVAAVVSLLAAWALHRCVERPLERRLRGTRTPSPAVVLPSPRRELTHLPTQAARHRAVN